MIEVTRQANQIAYVLYIYERRTKNGVRMIVARKHEIMVAIITMSLGFGQNVLFVSTKRSMSKEEVNRKEKIKKDTHTDRP